MTLPNYDQNQLTAYYEQQMRKRDVAQSDRGYSGTGYWWYGYPISTNNQMAYGATNGSMSTALPGPEATASVTDQVGGNVIADAGLQ